MNPAQIVQKAIEEKRYSFYQIFDFGLSKRSSEFMCNAILFMKINGEILESEYVLTIETISKHITLENGYNCGTLEGFLVEQKGVPDEDLPEAKKKFWEAFIAKEGV